MAYFIEAEAKDAGAQRHSFEGSARVGSGLDNDLYVPQVPEQWFEIDAADVRPSLVLASAGTKVNGRLLKPGARAVIRRTTLVERDGARLRIIPAEGRSRQVAFGSAAWPAFRLRFGLRSLLPGTFAAALACALAALFLSTGVLFERVAKAFTPAIAPAIAPAAQAPPAAAPRPVGPSAAAPSAATQAEPAAAAPQNPEQRIRTALAHVGLDSGVRLQRNGERLVISGAMTPEEVESVGRIVRTHGKGLAVDVRNLPAPAVEGPTPALRVRSFSVNPAFVLLSDGRRLSPGDAVGDGWTIKAVTRSETIIVRGGASRAISNGGAP